jgi:hypothetical protein
MKMSEPNTIRINEVDYVRKDSIQPTYEKRKDGPFEIGEYYFIRTVTNYFHGRLVEVTPTDFVLLEAVWIADTGRFHQFATGKAQPNEVEPYDPTIPVMVSRGGYIEMTKLPGKFKEQK